MAKRIIVTIVFTIFLAGFGLMNQACASQTVGSFDWKLSNVQDMQGHDIELTRPVLSLDVDYGYAFINVYGTLSSENGLDNIPASGSGYLYQDVDRIVIKMDIRSGSKLYRISLDMETLGGTFAIYGKDEQIEALGSIDLQNIYQ